MSRNAALLRRKNALSHLRAAVRHIGVLMLLFQRSRRQNNIEECACSLQTHNFEQLPAPELRITLRPQSQHMWSKYLLGES